MGLRVNSSEGNHVVSGERKSVLTQLHAKKIVLHPLQSPRDYPRHCFLQIPSLLLACQSNAE